MSGAKESRPSVSLRRLFREAIFVGATDVDATRCRLDAAKCQPGDTFFAGVLSNPNDAEQIELAMSNGASAFVTESLLPVPAPQCLIPDARKAFAATTSALAGFPSRELLTIGVLGSHGKTSTSLFVASMMKSIAGRVGYATSLGNSDGSSFSPTWDGRPGPQKINRWLRSLVVSNVAPAVLEISDSMLRDQSLQGQEFDVLVIPSLRPLQRLGKIVARNWQASMLKALELLKGHGMVIYNADDAILNRWIASSKIPAIGYGLDAAAEVQGRRLSRSIGEQTIMVTAGHALMPLTIKMPGDHHARHALAAAAVGAAFGLELKEILPGISRLQKIPGRLERVHCDSDAAVYVDQADQPDRLAMALHTLRVTHGGPITCVAEVPMVDSPSARAQFGRVLERGASQIFLTQCRYPASKSQKLMWEVLDGCERPAAVQLIPNRCTAIDLALRSSPSRQTILLAGWGTNGWTSGNDRTVCSDASIAAKLSRLGAQDLAAAQL